METLYSKRISRDNSEELRYIMDLLALMAIAILLSQAKKDQTEPVEVDDEEVKPIEGGDPYRPKFDIEYQSSFDSLKNRLSKFIPFSIAILAIIGITIIGMCNV